MGVYHILRDGSRPKDITGHVVKVEEATNFYEIIRKVNKRLLNEIHNGKSLQSNALSERKGVYTYE